MLKSGYHIPAVMRWPEQMKEHKVVDDIVSTTDFTPTILDILNADNYTSGKSLMNYVYNKQEKTLHHGMFTQTNGSELYGIQRSITCENWKYVYNGFDYDELYNIEKDPVK